MSVSDVERRTLEARARRLARRPPEPRARIDERDVVVFSLGRSEYAIELSCLRQVVPLRELALLPGAKPPLIGVAAWRGQLIRVLDLTRILELPDSEPTDRSRLLVLGDARPFALLADRVVNVSSVPETSLKRRAEHRFVRGVTADAVAVLDGAALIHTFIGEGP